MLYAYQHTDVPGGRKAGESTGTEQVSGQRDKPRRSVTTSADRHGDSGAGKLINAGRERPPRRGYKSQQRNHDRKLKDSSPTDGDVRTRLNQYKLVIDASDHRRDATLLQTQFHRRRRRRCHRQLAGRGKADIPRASLSRTSCQRCQSLWTCRTAGRDNINQTVTRAVSFHHKKPSSPVRPSDNDQTIIYKTRLRINISSLTVTSQQVRGDG